MPRVRRAAGGGVRGPGRGQAGARTLRTSNFLALYDGAVLPELMHEVPPGNGAPAVAAAMTRVWVAHEG